MDYEKELDLLIKSEPTKVYLKFLITLKSLFSDFIAGKVSDIMVSNLTVHWYVAKEEFSDALIKINPKIKELSIAMDITHPDYSKEKKVEIIKGLIKKIDDSLQID